MAAKTTAKFSLGCRAPWPGGRSARPAGRGAGRSRRRSGSFCPRTSVFSPSMAEMPVWMNSVRVVAGGGVHRAAVDVQALVGDDARAAVVGPAHAVKDAAQHVRGDGQLHAAAQEADLACPRLMPAGAFKQLHQRLVLVRPPAPGQRRISPFGSSISPSSSYLTPSTASTSISGPDNLRDGAVFLLRALYLPPMR